uniref:Uncharacterized protein n=1 Tax=Arundo donax TaxID=35708 RepID=A0A0A8Z5Y2_ARUDO
MLAHQVSSHSAPSFEIT